MNEAVLRGQIEALADVEIQLYDRDFLLTWEHSDRTIRTIRITSTIRAAVHSGRRPQTNESGAVAHDISMRTHR